MHGGSSRFGVVDHRTTAAKRCSTHILFSLLSSSPRFTAKQMPHKGHRQSRQVAPPPPSPPELRRTRPRSAQRRRGLWKNHGRSRHRWHMLRVALHIALLRFQCLPITMLAPKLRRNISIVRRESASTLPGLGYKLLPESCRTYAEGVANSYGRKPKVLIIGDLFKAPAP